MSYNNGYNNGNNGNTNNQTFARHIAEFIGETVIIFTTSGGESGSGFTGVILAVNCDFVRLVTSQGSAPTGLNPFDDDDDDDYGNNGVSDEDYYGNNGSNCGRKHHKDRCCNTVGSVADIPIDRIVAFVHNAI